LNEQLDHQMVLTAQLTILSALVQAVASTHPDPIALLAKFKQLVAIAVAEWNRKAIGLGEPGLGAEVLDDIVKEHELMLLALVRP